MLAQGRSYAALMVSLAAYAGLRIPEEVLAVEWATSATAPCSSSSA
ncbi:MAG TPA: hypothetical protein VFB44_10150 [Thermoleophilaceae bacterium]|nr:hypothetical protein [Thermoleophilaceae bacterium]